MPNPTSQGGTWSQFDCDVLIANLIAKLPGIPRTFVEIGCGDGSENNTRLLLEQGWFGTWVDASEENVRKAALINENSLCERMTCESMPPVNFGFMDLGLLSIDVDGNDWHLWKRAGELGWNPWLVVIEANIQKPFDESYIMPYNPDHEWDQVSHETGASVFSMIELGKEMGYRYWGKSENPHSPNLLFVRGDLHGIITA